jgi:hypothetical protein
MFAKSTDYGLFVTDPSLLRVANTPNTQFLLQAELRAIQNGFQYIEEEDEDGDIYKGYVDKYGLPEGVGMRIWSDGTKIYGEWHLNNRHGCVKDEWASGHSYWGEYKDGNREGYGTFERADGDRYIGQYMNDGIHGYGIYRWADRRVYYGQWKKNNHEG